MAHIAALQCVENGLIGLDEPVYYQLPELESLEVLSRNDGSDSSTQPFLVRPPTKKMTLHLLSHSSGIEHESNPLIREWRAPRGERPKAPSHLVFEGAPRQ